MLVLYICIQTDKTPSVIKRNVEKEKAEKLKAKVEEGIIHAYLDLLKFVVIIC